MDVRFKIKFSLYFIVTLVASLFAAQSTFAQTTTNQQMVVEGSLTDNAGSAIDLSGASLIFYVSTDKGCYLYGEATTTAGDSEGNINHRLGSGAVVTGSPNSYAKNIFYGISSGTTTFAGNNCTAIASDVRVVKVFYQAMDISAVLSLGSVPYAMYAQNATTLNGRSSVDFIQVSTDSNTLFNYGSAGQYLSRNASGYLTWVTPSVAAGAASSVTSVSAGEGLLGGVITSSGTLSVNFGTLPGTVAAGNDSRINGALQSVNNLSEIKNVSAVRSNLGLGNLATKSTVDLSSDTTGFLPVTNGGSPWQLSTYGLMTASNAAIGTTSSFSNVGLTVYSPSPSTNSSIAYFNSAASDGNGVRINVENTNSQKYGLKVGTSSSSITNFVVLNNGHVGVGTATPSARFELPAGTMTTAALKFNSGALLTSPASGSFEYDGNRLYITDDTNYRRVIPSGSNANTIDNITTITSPNVLTVSATGLLTPGSVGIGTISPVAKLHVYSTSGEIARFDAATTGAYMAITRNSAGKGYIGYTNGAGTLFNNELTDAIGLRGESSVQIGVGGTAYITTLSNGRVGIGTTSPTTTLTVNGSIRTTASIEFADGTSQTTSAFGSYERASLNCFSASSCQVSCPAGKKIIGGGCSNAGSATITSSNPVSDTQWYCGYGTGTTANLSAYAICVKM